MTKDFLEETIPKLSLAGEEKVAKPRTGHSRVAIMRSGKA